MTAESLRVVARFKSLPDKVAETRLVLTELIEPTRKEEGCVTYELLQNQDDPTDFTFVEEWSSHQALDLHDASAHIKALPEKVRGLIVDAPDVRRYSLIK